ncbi:MAG: hypothetical protein F4187_02480 [Gemmatimonadetes bacterium]|nr:hypothetical protein [Gemmatimonadota bacterium]
MIDSLGPVAYPLFLVSFLTLVQIGRGAIDVVGGDGPGSPLKIHSVLVLGALGACVGLVGSLMGVQAMATAITFAGEIDAATIWQGVGITVGPSVFGFLILGVAAVAWLVLQGVAGIKARGTW